MSRKVRSKRLLSLLAVLALTLSLVSPAMGATTGMGNFKKVVEYTPFPDVPVSAWYAPDVRKAFELGIVTGKANGRFDPMGNLTLAEAITMASKVRSIYEGGGFTPGGNPWYENAVRYAKEMGITYDGEYLDYTRNATRADMAGLFAFSVPPRELSRLNRIAWIPDVTPFTDNSDYIYLLYNAGVLTGNAAGSFQPHDPVTRGEAAAIINRIALSPSRRSFSLTTSSPGQVVTSADGSFQISVPKDMTYSDDEDSGFVCSLPGNEGDLQIITFPKYDFPNLSTDTMTEVFVEYITTDLGGDVTTEPYNLIQKGMRGTGFVFESKRDGVWYGTKGYCLENTNNYYILLLSNNDDCSDKQWNQLMELLYSLDLTL